MTRASIDELELRVLLLAPTSKDAAIAGSLLADVGIRCAVCTDFDALRVEVNRGVGAVLVAEEALTGEGNHVLRELVEEQPRWSDLPILVLTRHGADSPALGEIIATLGNVALLERPTRVAALISTARTALRARARQYQIRSHLEAREREERRRATELAVSQILAQATDADDALIRIVQSIGECLGWNAGSVWMIDEEALVLRHSRTWSRPTAPAHRFTAATLSRTFESGVGLPGRVWAEGRAAWISDVAKDANFPRAPEAAVDGLHGAFAFPIREDQRLVGVMEFFSAAIEEPDDGLMAMMNTIGTHIGHFLDTKRAEDALRRSERELNDFFENASIGLHWVGPDGRIVRVNRTELEMLGYTAQEYLGHHIAEFHQDRAEAENLLALLARGETVTHCEGRMRHKDGSIRDVLISSNVLWENGRFVHTRCFTRDVTDSRRLQIELQQSEALYRSIGESIEFGVWVCDADGQNIYTSDSFLRMLGVTWEQCAALGWAELLHPDDLERTKHAWQECVRTGGTWDIEHRFKGADGNYHPILARGVPVRDEKGSIIRWAGINLDISRLKKAELSLLEADRRKDEFLATLAHELRNPLAPIRNAVEYLRLQRPEQPEIGWAREIIGRQVQHLTQLVDDLLDVSRITRDKIELRKETVDLADVVRSAVETSQPLFESARHTLTVSLPPDRLELDADPLRLEQIFSNLLNNAAKYTPGGGRIELIAERDDAVVIVRVRDSGLGIAANMLPTIFDMFAQVHDAGGHSPGGLGIGLTLVRRFVEMHGGTVSAQSDGLGRGSEFVVRLPLLRSGARMIEPEARVASARIAQFTQRKFLVVDDNHDNAESLTRLLRLAGHEVEAVHDGEQALETLAQFRPEVVLLDIGLPNMDGYEVARCMRAKPEGRKALLIALTGWGQEDDRRRSKQAGFDHHLVKPVDLGALKVLLEPL